MLSNKFNLHLVNERIIEITNEYLVDFSKWKNLASSLTIQLAEKCSIIIPYSKSMAIYDLSITKYELMNILKKNTMTDFKITKEFQSKLFEVPANFQEPFTIDRSSVCSQISLDWSEIIKLFLSYEYTLSFYGFTPGFCYLDGLPKLLQLPRKSTPLVHVPAGSIAIAGGRVGIYPGNSAGGWWIIGHTSFKVFDLDRSPAFPIQPGDRIRFFQA